MLLPIPGIHVIIHTVSGEKNYTEAYKIFTDACNNLPEVKNARFKKGFEKKKCVSLNNRHLTYIIRFNINIRIPPHMYG